MYSDELFVVVQVEDALPVPDVKSSVLGCLYLLWFGEARKGSNTSVRSRGAMKQNGSVEVRWA